MEEYKEAIKVFSKQLENFKDVGDVPFFLTSLKADIERSAKDIREIVQRQDKLSSILISRFSVIELEEIIFKSLGK